MIAYEQALQQVLAETLRLGVELVPLDDAVGRVLAGDLCARWDLPPFDNSAMDGFAVVAGDTAAATREHPARLRVTGKIFAAPSHDLLQVAPGVAAYITTGAPIPAGADAVVRQEATTRDGDDVLVNVSVGAGENVRRRGEDAPTGRVLVARGSIVDPPAVALLATFGHAEVEVGRRPRVAILTSGDELVEVRHAEPGRITDSNSHVAVAQAREAGAEVTRLGIAADEVEDVAARLRVALEQHDVVVTIGGSSVGEHDVVRAAFPAAGVEVRFWNVAMKPGKPVGFGVSGRRLLFALPGNPAAAATTFDLFVRPAILALQGASCVTRPTLRGRLTSPVTKQPGVTYFLRARAKLDHPVVLSLPAMQGSGQLTPALGTDAYAVLPRGQAELGAGDLVDVQLLAAPPPASPPPVVCFVGPSGVGKTTLLAKVLARLSAKGLRVGALKHDAHQFQMDREGKDTFCLRAAGAYAIGIASKTERAVIASSDHPITLEQLVASLPPGLDLVLVEGYKNDDAPKIELHRRGAPLLWETAKLTNVMAVVSDDESATSPGPRLGFDDVDAVCSLLTSMLRSG